jgi:hypothetical protein
MNATLPCSGVTDLTITPNTARTTPQAAITPAIFLLIIFGGLCLPKDHPLRSGNSNRVKACRCDCDKTLARVELSEKKTSTRPVIRA